MSEVVSRSELERRRIEAGELLLKGMRQSEVASQLRVSRETVRRWAGKMGTGGLEALKNAPRLGRPAGLDPAQREQLAQLLQQGGVVHGFVSNDWSLSRVKALIQRQFGRSYSEVQVWRILGALGWSHRHPQPAADAQRPKRRLTREWAPQQI
jgi:transposase